MCSRISDLKLIPAIALALGLFAAFSCGAEEQQPTAPVFAPAAAPALVAETTPAPALVAAPALVVEIAPAPAPVAAPALVAETTPASGAPSRVATVIWSLPSEPRTAEEESALDAIPPPTECDRGDDGQPRRGFQRLSDLPQVDPEQEQEPLLDDGVRVVLQFTNSQGQQFLIIIDGAQSKPVGDYIAVVSVCLEAVLTSDPPPKPMEPIRLDSILVTAAAVETGRPPIELSKRRDDLSVQTIATLRDVILSFEGNPIKVRDAAAIQVKEEIERATKDGRLTKEEAKEDPLKLMEALLSQPHAPFLVNLEHRPMAGKLGELLRLDPRTLIITLASVGREKSVMWVFVDPPIDYYQYAYYRSTCKWSVWTRVRALEGSMAVHLWRAEVAYQYVEGASASKPDYSDWVNDFVYPEVTAWVAGVVGLENGSYYELTSTWYEGFGLRDCP